MEDVLDTYCLPYDASIPLICMDEQPVQLVKETRTIIPATPGHPERYDYEYERNGTANVFMFVEPLGNWRKVNIREKKTALDWALEIRELLDVDYADAERIRLVSKQRGKPRYSESLKSLLYGVSRISSVLS